MAENTSTTKKEIQQSKEHSSTTKNEVQFLDIMNAQLGRIEDNAKKQSEILTLQQKKLVPLANRIDDAHFKTNDLTKKVVNML